MEAMTQTLHEQQKTAWNKFSPGWEKWDDLIMKWMKSTAEKLVDSVSPVSGQVLDVATGTGEPGLSIAAKFPDSQVTGLDISEEMLRVAERKAKKKGLNNFTTVQGDESNLPFDEDTFDAVVSRFGVIFFPELERGIANLVRVLKPGGKLSVAVWGPREHNPWATVSAQAVMQELQLTPPPADAPGIFRCEQVGLVAGIMKDLGMKDVEETKITGINPFDTADEYWSMMLECAAPIAMALKDKDAATVEKIRQKVINSCVKYQEGGKVIFPYVSYVITATKP